jgi:hypothetical protein
MVTALAAHGFEHQKKQQPVFEEPAIAGTVSFLTVTAWAMEFLKDAQGGQSEGRHGVPPDQSTYCNPELGGKLRREGKPVSRLFAMVVCTCKAAFWHAKVRRSVNVSRKLIPALL